MFFDGVCGLCNWTVDFVMRRDRQQQFRFAPLQGATAEHFLGPEDRVRLHSVVIMHQGKVWRKSSAIVRMLWLLGGFWGLCGWLLWIVPRPLRDLAYRLIAMNRYRLFGEKTTCRMPTPAERARLYP